MPLLQDDGVALSVTDLRGTANGMLSLLEATAAAPGGVLSRYGLGGILPVDVTGIEIKRDENQDGVADGPVVLNADTDGDGVPDPSFDILVRGYFDFSPFAATGLTPSVTIGGEAHAAGAAHTFDTTFRVSDGRIRPWDVGPITIGLTGSPLDGVDIDGTLTLAGYQQGAWQPPVAGAFTGTLTTDLGADAEMTITLGSESLLDLDDDYARLVLTGDAAFDANVDQTFLGISIDSALLDFELVLEAAFTQHAPFVEFTRFDVTLGSRIEIDRFSANLADVFVITASDITVFPEPIDVTIDSVAYRKIGDVGMLEIDIPSTSALLGLSETSIVFSDIVLLEGAAPDTHVLHMGSVQLLVSGTLTAGGVELLEVDNLMIEFSDVRVDIGNFANLIHGSTISLTDFGAFATGIRASLASGVLLPDSPTVTASVTGLDAHFDAGGNMVFEIEAASASLFDELFQFHVTSPAADPDSPAARLQFGPDLSPSSPLLEVLGTASLSLSLLDNRAVTLGVTGLAITRQGEVSIQAASVGSATPPGAPPVGIGVALGLAEGVLPLDIHYLEIASSGSDPISFNGTDASVTIGDVDIRVVGHFDFSLFDGLPFDPVLSLGGQQATSDSNSTFELTFRVQDIATPAPKIQIQDTGPIELGVTNFVLGPLRIAPATVTLGGFENGHWQNNIGLDFGLLWDGADVDLGAGAVVNPQHSRLYGPLDAENPNPGAATLILEAALDASFATGNLRLNPTSGQLESTPGATDNWGVWLRASRTGIRRAALDAIRYGERIPARAGRRERTVPPAARR
ncbi:MAG: hypothetical protein AB7O38_10515 [Pirellulaceae bacterium]